MDQEQRHTAAIILAEAKRVTAFTGAGISVESGIPPFRGPGGLWEKYDPIFLDLHYFVHHPHPSWELIHKIFYQFFGEAKPNAAHEILAKLEQEGRLATIITQNIDHLHQQAGSRNVIEFHGTAQTLSCLDCHKRASVESVSFKQLPPKCSYCQGVLKPDFVFFSEAIPEPAKTKAFEEAEKSDVFVVIGTTGEIMPACMIPQIAKERGAKIIEINPSPSLYTETMTDVFLQGPGGEVLPQLYAAWQKIAKT